MSFLIFKTLFASCHLQDVFSLCIHSIVLKFCVCFTLAQRKNFNRAVCINYCIVLNPSENWDWRITTLEISERELRLYNYNSSHTGKKTKKKQKTNTKKDNIWWEFITFISVDVEKIKSWITFWYFCPQAAPGEI